MRASVVVASLNEADNLRKTVRSCLETTNGLDCEIIVADDHSRDDSIEKMRSCFVDVRVVAHETRRGVASTKHLGARSAAGTVLVFLDGHCKPAPGAIRRLIEDVEELDGRAIVVPAVSTLNTDNWESGGYAGNAYWVELTQFKSGWCDPSRLRRRRRFYESPALIGCCVATSRELYDELLGFDTGMREWGSEDLDFGLKAWFMGSSILSDPKAVVGHRFRTVFDNFGVSAVHPLVNQLRMARKSFDSPNWEAWFGACRGRARSAPDLWQEVLTTFEQGRESLEKERAYLFAHRTRDEYWYADYFDLPWPSQV
jgi:glycosyltransferase involved in cell wall biosynthesis